MEMDYVPRGTESVQLPRLLLLWPDTGQERTQGRGGTRVAIGRTAS